MAFLKAIFCSHIAYEYQREEGKERNCIIDSRVQSFDTSKHPWVEVS